MEDAQACTFTLEKQVSMLTEHMDDLENRGWCKSIRILGLHEHVEGADAGTFLQTWILLFFNLHTKGGHIKIEMAHRTVALRKGRGP